MKVQELLDGLKELNKESGEVHCIRIFSDGSGSINEAYDDEYVFDFYELEELKDHLEKDKPKVGDVGYFWDGLPDRVLYGKLESIRIDDKYKYVLGSNKLYYKNFSKTPPKID